jgi:tetratricopeptide (TPR) repeat protein
MAHDKYLWGLFNLGRATEEGTQDAIGNFQSAIGLDSNFAAAYAGLADAELASLNHSRATDLATLVADAEASAQAAVRLDPELSAAHASLGQAKFYAFDWSGAEAEFVRAVEADPDDPVIRQRYAAFLIAVGRVRDGLAHARVAVDRDPLSPAAWSQLLRVLRANGRYADAIGAGQEILRLNPNEASAWLDLGLLFLLELGAVDPREFAAFAEAAARHVADGAPGQVPADVLEAAGSAPVQRAVLQQLVGETDEALSTLSQAHRQRHPNLTTLNTRPELAPLRETLPFLTILADLGLSP